MIKLCIYPYVCYWLCHKKALLYVWEYTPITCVVVELCLVQNGHYSPCVIINNKQLTSFSVILLFFKFLYTDRIRLKA